MNPITVGALLVAALWVAILAMVWVHPLPDKPYANDLPAARPGTDDQWSAFRDTVPNIRRLADEELAWHPASRDAPVPARFAVQFPLRAAHPGDLQPTGGRHRRD